MAVRGDEPLKIMQRAGHERFETTQIYMREAEAIRTGFGDPFPPLPSALFGTADDKKNSARILALRQNSGRNPLLLAALQRGGRDSNPCLDASETSRNVADGRETRADAETARGGSDTRAPEGVDPIEAALAGALAAAAADRRWDVVGQLGRELEARRLAADPRVISIGNARASGRSDQR